MAESVKKYAKPMLYNGEPSTFPTYADQVIGPDGTPIVKDGKVQIDGVKASVVEDAYNGHDTTLAYSKDGLSSPQYLAAWDGYELRKVVAGVVREMLGFGSSVGPLDVKYGGTGGENAKDALANLFRGTGNTAITEYPTECGIFRTAGGNIFTNANPKPSNGYGTLVIFGYVIFIHLYSSGPSELWFAATDRSGGTTVVKPTAWKKISFE